MRITAIAICLLLISGCESIVDFPDVSQSHSYPVIEAMLTDQEEVQMVRVSHTVPLNDSASSKPTDNARVFVSSDTGDTVFYQYTSNGLYTSLPYRALPGRTYTLTVQTDSTVFQSSASLISMHGIDSLYCKNIPGQNNLIFNVYLNAGPVDASTTKYYQANIFRNDTILTRSTDIAIFNDKYLTSLKGIKLPYTYADNDKVLVEVLTLSEEMYAYYLALTTNLFSISFSNMGYKTNPPQMFNKPAFGYFQVSAVCKKQIVIHL